MPRRRSSAVRRANLTWDGIEVFDPKEFLARSERVRGFFAAHLARAPILELEIGCGMGNFILHAASQHPKRHFIGIEYAKKFIRFIRDQKNAAELSNMTLICGEAMLFVENCLPDACLDAVHLYFPDPWPKKSQHKRRFLGERGLLQIARVLKVGGRLYFTTDHQGYAEMVRDLLPSMVELKLQRSDTSPEHYVAYGGKTHFGDKYIRQGKAIYCFEAVRR